ncbi:hypothetical protein G7K_3227-t1 [Saitoella complicata NRRL Y-17804]|uniref:Uncharacterized protein n=2 Tax=Saitoella complicata (strain BCRC 22490 / CBS 7301 / JCM 7358 / NBRC 10748 / NRRL Y-17804) TaxID=698492 RepID=A0A0E9NGQ6_SAICN|nr:hypothetical protein G7K_3227-t1 [Saitoella complicata NRRL Y-17804]
MWIVDADVRMGLVDVRGMLSIRRTLWLHIHTNIIKTDWVCMFDFDVAFKGHIGELERARSDVGLAGRGRWEAMREIQHKLQSVLTFWFTHSLSDTSRSQRQLHALLTDNIPIHDTYTNDARIPFCRSIGRCLHSHRLPLRFPNRNRTRLPLLLGPSTTPPTAASPTPTPLSTSTTSPPFNPSTPPPVALASKSVGGRGLDVSTGGATEVFGQNMDPAPARWEVVDGGFCEFVWSGVTGYDVRANADGMSSAATSTVEPVTAEAAATAEAATITAAAVAADTTSSSTSTSSSETITSTTSSSSETTASTASSSSNTTLSPVILYSNTTLSSSASSIVAPWSNTTLTTAVPTVAAAVAAGNTKYVASTSTSTVTVTLWDLPSTTSSDSYVEGAEAVTRTVYTTVWHTAEATTETQTVEVTETESRTHARQFATAAAYWNGTLTAASNGTVVNGIQY